MAGVHEDPNKEALFVASARTGHIEARDFSNDEAAVNRVEHKLDLINCLTYMAQMSMRHGLTKLDPSVLAQRYKGKAGAVQAGAYKEQFKFRADAMIAFGRASGYYALIKSGLMTELEAAAVTSPMFEEFRDKYYGPANSDKAKDYIKELSDQVDGIRINVSIHNRKLGKRPHKRLSRAEKVAAKTPRQLEALDSRSRVIGISHDPRAMFYPANNTEKNTIMSWLDYFDNPEYPLGIGNQVLEAMIHSQKIGTRFEAVRTAESIAWETGDMVVDAADAHERLESLQEDLDGISPDIHLAEVEDLDTRAIAHLLRYEAVEHFAKTGETRGLSDVLLVKEDRWVKGGSDPGRHKTIHSHFTTTDARQPASTKDYIAEREADLTVKEVRALLKRAIPNEFTRLSVGLRCLDDLEASLTGEYRMQSQIAFAIRSSRSAVADKPVVQSILNEHAQHAA